MNDLLTEFSLNGFEKLKGVNLDMKNEDIRKRISDANKIVVKVGTDCLTDENSKLDEGSIEKLVGDLMDLVSDGKEIILVSSGAIGAGVGRLSLDKMPEDMESLQAASTIGQSLLMRKYSEIFEDKGRHIAQLLLTREDFTNVTRFENLKNTIKALFKWGVVPIINENDAIAVEEIRMGDNDLLSAFTSSGIEADLLVILTDVDGLYTEDPKKVESADPIRVVEEVTSEIEELTRKTTDGEFGGMFTKVQAAKMANEEGIPVVITKASKDRVLQRLLDGEKIGTYFSPKD